MLRSIAAVIVSYIVMGILISGMFMGMWFGMGPDGLLKPGSFQGNMIINIAAPAITVIVGLFGGWMCAKIGRSGKPVMALAGLVLVLGLTMAFLRFRNHFRQIRAIGT